MRYYFAPMEGLTDSVYRRLHHKYFGGIDRYYMPFLSPTIHRTLPHMEDRELPMANSVDFGAVPQVLTKVPGDFLWAAEQCRDRGYEEVNLNVGCPSGTVVSKGKGAGMLAEPEELARFLDEVFAKSPLPVERFALSTTYTPFVSSAARRAKLYEPLIDALIVKCTTSAPSAVSFPKSSAYAAVFGAEVLASSPVSRVYLNKSSG